jgi:regulator of sirC expression with transglutaminase-like and TPR domain
MAADPTPLRFEALNSLDYFRLLVEDAQSIPLLEAAFSLAVDADPTLDLLAALSEFDQLATDMAQHCRGSLTERDRLQRALVFFYKEKGFAGNADDYYHPDNSYLHKVLQTRRGIPITLGVLFSELVRPIGLEVDGVPFPGHFLLRARLREGIAILDPFTGDSLSQADLERRAAPYGMRPERLLHPASARQILIRMLSNLQAIYSDRGEHEMLQRVQARMAILQESGSR